MTRWLTAPAVPHSIIDSRRIAEKERGAMRQPLPTLTTAFAILGGGLLVSWLLGAPLSALLALAFAGVTAIIFAVIGAERNSAETPVIAAMTNGDDQSEVSQGLHTHPDFGAFVDTLPFPMMLVRDAKIAAANRSARSLLGAFIVGADVRSAIRHPAAADRLANPRHRDRNGGAIDLVGIGRPGQRWEMRTIPQPDGSRIVALTDQTARDAAERMRADFVANASHELRTPLAAILGFIETLSDPEAGDDSALRQRFLSVIDKEARRMLRLVEDLLSISRIEASKGHLPDDVVDIVDVAADVVDELSTGADARAADLVSDMTDSAPVRGDRVQLSQMMHNIVGNAMKYGRAGTPVTVRVQPAGPQMIELSVTDRGDGIPAEQIPRLTERFYRVDSARSRSLGGTGLGLAIVKHVVERHRGRLEIDSVEGEGTTVRIRLPLVSSPQNDDGAADGG